MLKKLLHLVLAGTILTSATGCFGEFSLTRKVYQWNQGVSGEKFVQTLVMYALFIIPVYEVAGFADLVILNLVEFWTGSNPIAMEDGEVEEQIIAFEGENYVVQATKNQFKIYPEGKECEADFLYFNEVDSSWNMIAEGDENKLVALEEHNGSFYYRLFKDGSSYTKAAPTTLAQK